MDAPLYWIVGAGSGIGRAMALKCLAQGCRVYLSGRRQAALEETAALARELPGQPVVLPLDAARPGQAAAAAGDILDRHGRIDALALSVGAAAAGGLADTSLETWRHMATSHLDTVFLACQAALPGLTAAPDGNILIIGSIFGLRGKANRLAYCTVKGGIVNFTRSLALELAGQVRVNSICPGWVATDMSLSLVNAAPDPAAALQDRRDWHPMGRGGSPEEVAETAWFVMSGAAAWMTGQNIALDGGYTAR